VRQHAIGVGPLQGLQQSCVCVLGGGGGAKAKSTRAAADRIAAWRQPAISLPPPAGGPGCWPPCPAIAQSPPAAADAAGCGAAGRGDGRSAGAPTCRDRQSSQQRPALVTRAMTVAVVAAFGGRPRRFACHREGPARCPSAARRRQAGPTPLRAPN
jgi:hypothetical protein